MALAVGKGTRDVGFKHDDVGAFHITASVLPRTPSGSEAERFFTSGVCNAVAFLARQPSPSVIASNSPPIFGNFG